VWFVERDSGKSAAAGALLANPCWALGGDVFRNILRKHALFFNLAMAALLVYTAVVSLLPHG